MNQELIDRTWKVLEQVTFPGMSRSIVSFGFVDRVTAEDDRAAVHLAIQTRNRTSAEQVKEQVETALEEAGIDAEVRLAVTVPESPAQQAVSSSTELIPEVDNVIAIASGKGGVGKSTIAANLAVSLAQQGHAVGILDADIYGPSLPMMFGITDKPKVEGNRIDPFDKFGVKVMSLGFVLDVDTPVIWRGPMIVRAIEQLLGDVNWGPLDYLVVDLPPGTGDAQLTLAQKVPISGALMVTTPQDLALIDVRKGLAMFRKVEVPVLGIVENMAGFACPHCGEVTPVFGEGGGERTAEALDCEFLGSIPLDPAIVVGGDRGTPIVAEQAEGSHSEAFAALAQRVAAAVADHEKAGVSIV